MILDEREREKSDLGKEQNTEIRVFMGGVQMGIKHRIAKSEDLKRSAHR